MQLLSVVKSRGALCRVQGIVRLARRRGDCLALSLKGLVVLVGRAESTVGGAIRAVSSSDSEESDDRLAEIVEEKDDVELLPRARRGSASGMLPLLRWRWEYTASSYGMV